MSRITNIAQSISIIPSGYTGLSSLTTTTNYPVTNGYTDSSSTTYARFTLSSGSTGYLYYTFDCSSIPADATITTITGTVKAYVSSTSRVTSTQCQLFTGTTAKGSNVTFASTSSSNTVNITPGTSWTRNELDDLRLKIGGTGSSSSGGGGGGGGGGNSSRYIYFYGANITINYTVPGVEYEITSTLATDTVDSIDPSGVTYVEENGNYELNIYANSIDDFKVEDNDIDVTSSLVQHEISSGGTLSTVLGEYTLVSGSFNGSGATWFSGIVGNGADTSNTTTSNYYSSASGTIAVFNYKLVFDNIPSNATITRLYAQVNGHAESTSQSNEYMCAQLRAGDTELSDELNFKSVGTSNSTQTIEATTLPTVSQLQNLILYCRLGYYGGAINGATCYIEYTTPSSGSYYWTYTLNNVSADHTIIISDSIIEIPDEDPEYNYYPITISSINATTTPGRGTTRVIEGTNQTITIYPSESQVTLVTDNGVDITSQLVQHGDTISDPTVATASGASYGFNLDSSTGYYVSQNAGQSSSAAVCRVTFNLPVRCLVTIQYINSGEATYDFGVFGKVDTTLSTSGWTASSSSGDTTTDAGLEQLRCNTSEYNSTSPKTLTYEIQSGTHYIDIKYGKDQSTDSGNDSLQWKILSIEPLEANNYYTYNLSNIQEEHSLIFIFGDVTYYFISSSGTNARLFPSGSLVYLPGDYYSLTIVPDDYSYEVSVIDNNVDVASQVERKEEEITKNGSTYTVVNYIYKISNVQATHNIVVTCQSSSALYLKITGSFTEVRTPFVKVSGAWRSVDDISTLFESNKIYVKRDS